MKIHSTCFFLAFPNAAPKQFQLTNVFTYGSYVCRWQCSPWTALPWVRGACFLAGLKALLLRCPERGCASAPQLCHPLCPRPKHNAERRTGARASIPHKSELKHRSPQLPTGSFPTWQDGDCTPSPKRREASSGKKDRLLASY